MKSEGNEEGAIYRVKYDRGKVQNLLHDVEGFASDLAWDPVENLKQYEIKYGADVNDIGLRDGRLYDVHSEDKVVLVEGPYKGRRFRETYNEVSVWLYKEMKRLEKGV